MKISLSQRVPNSRASERNAENVGSPLMSRPGQIPSSCRQLEIGLWDYNFFIHFTLFTVILHVPLSMQASYNILNTFNVLTSVLIVEASPNSNNMMVKVFSDHKCTAFGFLFSICKLSFCAYTMFGFQQSC